MQKLAWQEAISSCADPRRAADFYERLRTGPSGSVIKKASSELIRILTALFSGSQALSELLAAHPEWVAERLDPDFLQHPRQKQGLEREIQQWLKPLLNANDYTRALDQLRTFKQHQLLRIAARDLARLANAGEITAELSDLADVCVDMVYLICSQQMADRVGSPFHQGPEGDWMPTGFCILGLGKLGGQELNYSSDIDVVFVYSEEGFVFKELPAPGKLSGKSLSNHQFFLKLSEAIVHEISQMTASGALYRIDLRLRPEGNSGPLARSLNSFENYYAQWGQTWERMMLIKARPIAGDPALGSEFLEMIQPFRYPRSLSERILKEIAGMKQRIESEVVKSGEIERNVKLGRGGIREIEFIVQTLQLLKAGRIPFLQDSQTLSTLQKLVRYKLLSDSEAEGLSNAYIYLRDVEHRLQMENNLQTHTIPTQRKSRERLAALMGFKTIAEFETAKAAHAGTVRHSYDKLLRSNDSIDEPTLPDISTGEESWLKSLEEHSFREPARALQLLREFIYGPGYVHVSPRTSELASELVPKFLALCPKKSGERPPAPGPELAHQSRVLSDPDRVVARMDRFISSYGSRSILYELWTSNPSLFELLLLLFDRSEFLAETAIRTPDLVDELELSGRLRRRKSAGETLEDLRHGIDDADQHLWIRRYFQAELMRVGLRDILGLADFEQSLVELTALADACLQYALQVVLKKNRLRKSPMAIVGLGKLGGQELNYGSDLDIMFVADPKQKDLPSLQRLAADLMDLISAQTEMGSTFPTDPRLRPDGEKGLLVNTLTAYEDYYRNRAQLWEIQAISRTRFIAGEATIGQRFQELAARLTDFKNPVTPPLAFKPDWKREIHKMRLRIEKERTPAGKEELAIKTGAGGLMDAEFIAQIACLENGWHEPNTLSALVRAFDRHVLPPDRGEALIGHYKKLRRIEGILRRWSYAGETLLPDDPAPLYRVAVRCGFRDADEFLKAVSESRAEIRSAYSQALLRE